LVAGFGIPPGKPTVNPWPVPVLILNAGLLANCAIYSSIVGFGVLPSAAERLRQFRAVVSYGDHHHPMTWKTRSATTMESKNTNGRTSASASF
jgi:hypothetical protein